MLVLSRRIGEEIVIGDATIRITVVDLGRNRVRLGIDAPENVVVDREEIHRLWKEFHSDSIPEDSSRSQETFD